MNMNVEAGRPRIQHAGATMNVNALNRCHTQLPQRGLSARPSDGHDMASTLTACSYSNHRPKLRPGEYMPLINFTYNSLMLTHLALNNHAPHNEVSVNDGLHIRR
jgi:hypothetical protein